MHTTSRSVARDALGPALIAAALAVVAALALRYFFAVPMPAELYADQATTRIPLQLFETMLTTFGSASKHLYLISGLIAEAALTALAGVLYAVARTLILAWRSQPSEATPPVIAGSRLRLSYADAPFIMLALWALSAVLLAPLIGGGLFGVALQGGARMTLLAQVAPDLVFALSFIGQSRGASRGLDVGESGRSTGAATGAFPRRTLLGQSVLAAVTLGGGIAIWQALTSGLGALIGATQAPSSVAMLPDTNIPTRIVPPPAPVYSALTPLAGQTPEVTSAANFYYVSKDLAGDPMVAQGSWTLAITGMVDAPYSLTYAQLRALPQVTQYHTLECISNEVGGSLMSNGFFTGVRLADVLNTARIQSGATQLIFKAADGYSDSLHLAQALDDRSIIAYLLNGEALPIPHGFPARLLIPGLFGMKNGKWLTELSLASGSYTGYWEQRGWTPNAFVKLTSRIDTPQDGDLLAAGPTTIAGVAYSGDKGIARVDISVDSGKTWKPALLKRPLGALTWALWQYPWTPTTGEQVIIVRAIDLEGNVQTPLPAPTLPDGASGYHSISVTAR